MPRFGGAFFLLEAPQYYLERSRLDRLLLEHVIFSCVMGAESRYFQPDFVQYMEESVLNR